jgi:predicted adenylyl cyclase CyaB
MPANMEIKARVHDFDALRVRAAALSDTPVQIISQEDMFFNAPAGRLKLRVLAAERAQLIFYNRPDSSGPKRSDYHIYETVEPEALKHVLALALGIRGVVRKTRYLYLAGQTRIHLDDVNGLGQFLELEVVLRPQQAEADAQAFAADLMAKLGVADADLLEGAYMDLIENP